MMDGGGSLVAFYPVIFFDGEREIEVGDVGVYPTMNYKLFQSVISQKMGISPHQITIYFERYTTSPSPFKDKFNRRRSPVTNKFNFSAVFHEPDSFFWVVLKRSRRLRRHKSKQSIRAPISDAGCDEGNYVRSYNIAPENPIILRRNSWTHGDQFSQPPMGVRADGRYADYADYANNRMQALGRERERYLTSLNLNSNLHSELHMKGTGLGMNSERVVSDDGASCSSSSFSSGGGGGERTVVCGVCTAAGLEGQKAVPFHCCKCDPTVDFGFRSPAGPIARPANHSG